MLLELLKLERPIVFFDLETTGKNKTRDRIVSISTYKIFPDGRPWEVKKYLINPGMPIPAEATEVHKITDDDVKKAPYFKQFAANFVKYIYECDLAGFNSNTFDIPLLAEELKRCGVDFPTWKIWRVDVRRFYQMLFPQTLSDIYRQLFDKELDGAHDAEADNVATIEIMDKLMQIHGQEMTPQQIDEMTQGDKKFLDFAQTMYTKNGKVFFAFGKNADCDVMADKGYVKWYLETSDFPKESKDILRELKKADANGSK